jgi:PPOX class probable F420-dependent enzyme
MAPVNRRQLIRMSDEEIAALLDAGRTLHVATINRDGTPHLVPLYYVVIDGVVTFWTYTKSQKIRNLERDPRLTVMVEVGEGYDQLRGVQINGTAQLSTDLATVSDVGGRIYARYFGEFNETARESVTASARKRTTVRVQPLRVASWDHRKLAGAY